MFSVTQWIYLFGAILFMMLVAVSVFSAQIARRQRERERMQFQQRLLERLDSAREFGQFLATDEGVRFLNVLGRHAAHPKERALALVQAGVVLVVVGPILAVFADFSFGISTLGLGVGLIAAALISYLLARKMGMLDEPASAPASRRTPLV